jgi:hypothetical protein
MARSIQPLRQKEVRMSKKFRHPKQSSQQSSRRIKANNKKAALAFGLLLALSVAGGILAQWRSLHNKVLPNAATLQESPDSASNPSKENFYSGGRLIASEEPQTPYYASFVSQTVHAVMVRGSIHPTTITMKNTGGTDWPAGNSITLQNQSPVHPLTSTSTVNLPAAVPANNSNSEVTFSIQVTAPDMPGRYNFRWQMQRSGFGFFGELTPNVSVLVRTDIPSDFDGDGIVDIVVWRPSEGNWYVIQSGTNTVMLDQLGQSGDRLVPGDYDGDRRTDLAIFKPSTGDWYIKHSSTQAVWVQTNWGNIADDREVPADYDGDGRMDIAIFRPSEGNWYIIQSSNGNGALKNWGGSGDVPAPGDYDGDGKADTAVFRPTEGNWYIRNSSNGATSVQGWGSSGDRLVPADYDGDGKTDIAVWRPTEGNWYIRHSSDNTTRVRGWGAATDKPVPADYDNDGKIDIAVWRPSEGNWYIIKSSNGGVMTRNWGAQGDIPVSSVYVRCTPANQTCN